MIVCWTVVILVNLVYGIDNRHIVKWKRTYWANGCCLVVVFCVNRFFLSFCSFGVWILLDTIKIYGFVLSVSVRITCYSTPIYIIHHTENCVYHMQDNRTLSKHGRNKMDYLANDKIWNEVMDFIFLLRYETFFSSHLVDYFFSSTFNTFVPLFFIANRSNAIHFDRLRGGKNAVIYV